jgi:predicted small lipoprotein YifL
MRQPKTQWPSLLLLLLLSAGSVLSGCGKKGPLYLPPAENPPQTKQ